MILPDFMQNSTQIKVCFVIISNLCPLDDSMQPRLNLEVNDLTFLLKVSNFFFGKRFTILINTQNFDD